jgi:hypothetical protein
MTVARMSVTADQRARSRFLPHQSAHRLDLRVERQLGVEVGTALFGEERLEQCRSDAAWALCEGHGDDQATAT